MPSARDHAADLLLELECRGERVRDGLERLRGDVPDPRERALLTELAYGAVRRQGSLDVVAAAFSRRRLEALDPPARTALRLALYQALFLDRIPAAAAVDHAVGWVKRRTHAGTAGFVNGVLRAVLRGVAGPATGAEDARRDLPREDGGAVRFVDPILPDAHAAPVASIAARWSLPEWLVAKRLARLGFERTRALAQVEVARPSLILRVRRGTVEDLRARLARGGPQVREGPVQGSLLLRGGDSGGIAVVEEGLAAVQDATAQRVAPVLAPRTGERLLDLCAAPGGKALHLADLLGAAGEVVACDVDARKVEQLEALRPSVPPGVTWTPTLVPAEGPLPFAPASFDGVLVDAPCSNTGVLRRRVEARWRVTPGDVTALAAQQRELLERALPLVRSGGRLVYATCSLEPEENGDLGAAFEAAHGELEVETAFDVLPTPDADGGFALVARRR
jgi:16S rRNA (cytosine967-C5)-methyltransferase